jgi:hypothetical protein
MKTDREINSLFALNIAGYKSADPDDSIWIDDLGMTRDIHLGEGPDYLSDYYEIMHFFKKQDVFVDCEFRNGEWIICINVFKKEGKIAIKSDPDFCRAACIALLEYKGIKIE